MRTCCSSRVDASRVGGTGPRLGRVGAVVGWSLPIATLALVPKCPMCVAGYVALITGAGISLGDAAALRTTVIVLSGLAIGLLAARAVWRVMSAAGK